MDTGTVLTPLAGSWEGLGWGGQGTGMGAVGHDVALSPALSPATCKLCKAPPGLLGALAKTPGAVGNGAQHPLGHGAQHVLGIAWGAAHALAMFPF